MNAKSTTQQNQTGLQPLPQLARGVLQRKCACGQHTIGGAECGDCGKDEQKKLKRSAINDQSFSNSGNRVPSIVNDVLRAPGSPLDAGTRNFFEPRFNHDFSHVRVHTDESAADSAKAVSASAYTVGRHVVFGAGHFAPSSSSGRELIAHELTHTLQQPQSDSPATEISEPSDTSEVAASQLAAKVMSAPASNAGPPNEPGKTPTALARNVLQRHTLENDPATAPAMACSVAPDTVPDYLLNINFGENQTTLSAIDKQILADFATEWNLAFLAPTVRVDGFASIEGGPAGNWPLSCNRAKAVADELISPSVGGKPGIPSSSVNFFANGETERFSSDLVPNQTAAIHAPGMPLPSSREPSVHNWASKITGATDPLNCCRLCPVNLGVDCDSPNWRNGIEFTISIRDHNAAYSYDIKRTLEQKGYRSETPATGLPRDWKTIASWTRPAGTDDDTHNSDECRIPQASGSVHKIYSEDRPGFRPHSLLAPYDSYVQKVNFIEFVRITRADGSTYDDPMQQQWHTKARVENVGGTWQMNIAESQIGTGHLSTLDP